MDIQRKAAIDKYKAAIRKHEASRKELKKLRESYTKQRQIYEKTEQDILALQSVGQIIGEILQTLSGDKYIVKTSMGTRYLVVAREAIPQEKLTVGARVALDSATKTIMRVLSKQVDPKVFNMLADTELGKHKYTDVGGLDNELRAVREVIELPITQPEFFERVGIRAPKGVLLYGPPGTGKTLIARTLAANVRATFIRVVASSVVERYIGESSRILREMFAYAKAHQPAIIFLDEIDAIGGRRLADTSSADREVQRALMELLHQLDGFDDLGQVKVIMATNRPDILDPALLRPGRLDRKIEIKLPNSTGRYEILKIHSKKMGLSNDISFESIVKATDGFNGADLRNVCTEAGMFAIRDKRNIIVQEDFDKSVRKLAEAKKLETKLEYKKI